ncbi:hypothetical protein ACFFSY_25230 [Paenibacillus aurantiacus]|uniref:DUF4111 domain-containing protein n=1 Tax=Paenibacillus aurantiacus TaxID=1936118 RepID=A0ABV5KYF2_9BACL
MALAKEVERINGEVSGIMRRQLGRHLIGLIVQGSAVKGGVIPGSSDIDYVLYVVDEALSEAGRLPLSLCLAIHRELSRIDPAPFRYIQFSVASKETCAYLPPIAGTYRLLAGRLLLPEATNAQILADAEASLRRLNPAAVFDSHSLLDHGEDRIERCARLMCTIAWPVAYQLLTLLHGDGVHVWCLTKQEVAARLAAVPDIAEEITHFHEAVLDYYPEEASAEKALTLIEGGMSLIETAKRCFAHRMAERSA